MDDSDGPLEPTLRNLMTQTSLKWIFVGGKGGVGKTTTSCSLGVLLSGVRKSVLIVSTDPAHNLSDAFGQRFGPKPIKVNGFDNLSCLEVEPSAEGIAELQESMVDPALAATDPSAGGGAQEMLKLVNEIGTSIPGVDEAMSFTEIMKLVDSLDFDVVVFDTAPTGHTLRLLSFPRTIDVMFEKLDTMKDRLSGMMGQVAALMGGGANPADAVMAKMEETRKIVTRVHEQFKNPDLTTFVCVCIPEFLSLYETERLVQELTKFEIDVHNIVVNQVIFAEPDACRKLLVRKKMQDKYLEQIHALYEDFHIVVMPTRDEEVRGPKLLKVFAQYLSTPYVPPTSVQGVPSATSAVKALIEKYDLDESEVRAFLESKGLPVPL